MMNLPVLGAIPRERGIDEDGLLSQIKSSSLTYQAYSELRTNLIFSHEEELQAAGRKGNSMVITPVMPMPRGPHVSVNLAASIASTGRRVLLIDCDMRDPRASRLLESEGKTGLAEILESDKDAFTSVVSTRFKNLYLLPAGKAKGDPTDLLSLSSFSELLRSLEWKYDQVLLDAPVLGTSVDAALAASVVSSPLVVIDYQSCTRALANQALDSLRLLNIEPTGIILTGVKLKGRERMLRSMPKGWVKPQPEEAAPSLPGRAPQPELVSARARIVTDEAAREGSDDGEEVGPLAEAVRLGRAGAPLPVNWLASLISDKPGEKERVEAAFYAYYEAALDRYGIEPIQARKMADEILRMTRREGEYAGMSKVEINERFKQMLVKAGARSPSTGGISQF
jgi:capsular exopolysaccharide synthesis family protein